MSTITEAVEAMDWAGEVIDQLREQNEKFRDALQCWYDYWDDRYDGEPLKDYEVKMLKVMGKSL